MSTTSTKSKKVSAKTVVKPRYRMNQKVFFISTYRDKPENIYEMEIREVHQREVNTYDKNKKVDGTATLFSYLVVACGLVSEKQESELLPNYQQAANQFALECYIPLSVPETPAKP